MDEKDKVAHEMLRGAMGRSIRASLRSTAERLQKAASALRELEWDVERIGLEPEVKGHRVVTAESILAEALTALHTNAPDLGTLARSVEEYNRHVRPAESEAEPVPGCETVTMGAACTHEPLAGLRVCFGHLWQAARSRGVGNVFPVGSPEPKEASVPTGTVLVGENGVQWKRSGWGDWEAGGPAGDGQRYHWSRVNGHNQDGLELALLLPEVVR